MRSARRTNRSIAIALGLLLLGGVLWLRWPGFGFNVWSLDEAIHATAARVILHGGVLYHDVIDQRTPLSYYAVAGVFSMFGENNLWAVRCGIAILIAATALILALTAWKWRGRSAGTWTAALYAILACALPFPGDANAAHTEWFVAFFTALAAWIFLTGSRTPSIPRTGVAGLLLGFAFLSKQPALLDLGAPVGALLCFRLKGTVNWRQLWARLIALGAGWLLPVALTAGYFAVKHALTEGLFYTWFYNLDYYGSDTTAADRLTALLRPFQHLITSAPLLLLIWLVGGLLLLHSLLQREPTEKESTSMPVWSYLTIWSLTSLAGSASGGRNFDHYFIQFLPALALGCGLGMGRITQFVGSRSNQGRWLRQVGASILILVVAAQLGSAAWSARASTLPLDPSIKVSAYIREHSSPDDRIFVWGFHPDIYLFANRLPGSRYLYGSFQTGLIPWINVAPDRDTTATIVPGAMSRLLEDLETSRPLYIVDCSAGPNRHWQKYPLEKFPRLNDYIQNHYQVIEGGQFVPQGFRLFARLPTGSNRHADDSDSLPQSVMEQLAISTLASPISPISASAPNGAAFSMRDGRAEYFAHAPSRLVYQIPSEVTVLRGGFGIRPEAYAPSNPTPTDGAEFIIRWRSGSQVETTLLRQVLEPMRKSADRTLQSFRVILPAHDVSGELILSITAGPTDNPACDWTFWTDLMFENLPLDPKPTPFSN